MTTSAPLAHGALRCGYNEGVASVCSEQWSYFPWVAKVPSVNSLGEAMNMLGADGWELVTSVTTVKSWLNLTGNDLVFVLKSPALVTVCRRTSSPDFLDSTRTSLTELAE